jgi:hypothetical protein
LVNRWYFGVIAALSACVVVPGCGNNLPTATVRGKVAYKGKPVDSGRVVLFPESGVVSSGKLASDGRFTIHNRDKGEEIAAGKYKIAVVAGLEQIDLRPNDPKSRVEPRVPLKFTSASTTPLEFEFKEGPNDISITLDEPPTVKANSATN